MADLFHNPHLTQRVGRMGKPHRFINLPIGACEQVVTVRVGAYDRGMIGHMLSIDILSPDDLDIWSCPIAVYPYAKLESAEHDGMELAERLGLCCRSADPNVGWLVRYDPDLGRIASGGGDSLQIG